MSTPLKRSTYCFPPLASFQVFDDFKINRDNSAIVRMIARVNGAAAKNSFAIAHIAPELLGPMDEDYTGPSLSTCSRGVTPWKN